jgi:hypothetical protein
MRKVERIHMNAKLPRLLVLLPLALAMSSCIIPTGPVTVTRSHKAAEGVVLGSGTYNLVEAVPGGTGATTTATPYLAAVGREMQRVGYKEKLLGSDFTAQIDVAFVRSGGAPTSSTQSPTGRIQTILSVRIVRNRDQQTVWQGSAKQDARAGSPAAQPGIAASKLAQALFQDFPGESGATISVP